MGEPEPTLAPGAQVKVNLMLRRLPRLRDDSVTPEQAFGGTFHINETFSQLDTAYTRAEHGVVPDPLPCEIYCHSLTDPSILSDRLRESGAQTLTVFGLHTPHSLIAGADPDRMRDTLTSAVLNSLNSVLAEPIQDVLMEDSAGRLCIEAKTTLDLERTLGMTARQHLPRRAVVAVRRGRRAARHTGAALGCGDGARPDPVVRLGVSPRRRGVGHRRPQRRDGGAGELGHRRGPRHVALEAEFVGHGAVAVPEVAVAGLVAAGLGQQRPQSQYA